MSPSRSMHKLGVTLLLLALGFGGIAAVQAQSDGACTNLAFFNPPAASTYVLNFDLPTTSAIVENVVVPPDAATGEYRPCTAVSPRYVVTCSPGAGSTSVTINFNGAIGPGQWVAVSVRTTSALSMLPGVPTWEDGQGMTLPAPYEILPRVVINELVAGTPDWIEILNLDPVNSIDLSGWKVEFRSRGTAVGVQIFNFDPAILPSTILPPLGRAIIHDGLASVGPAALDLDITLYPGAFMGSGSSGINMSCTSEGSAYLLMPGNAAPFAPVDALVFGYFREANANALAPDLPAPDTLQSYCENTMGPASQHHSLYRMRGCLRFDPDAFSNRQLPGELMVSGTGPALVSPVTLGDVNPGECVAGGPVALVLGVSQCPTIVTLEGAVPGSLVYWFVSDLLQPTQSSGSLIGLHFSPLLFASIQSAFGTASIFSGIASSASECGAGVGRYDLLLGALPPLCLEFAAVGYTPTAAGPILMQTNVVRVH